jgi:hypothetical protein
VLPACGAARDQRQLRQGFGGCAMKGMLDGIGTFLCFTFWFIPISERAGALEDHRNHYLGGR